MPPRRTRAPASPEASFAVAFSISFTGRTMLRTVSAEIATSSRRTTAVTQATRAPPAEGARSTDFIDSAAPLRSDGEERTAAEAATGGIGSGDIGGAAGATDSSGKGQTTTTAPRFN